MNIENKKTLRKYTIIKKCSVGLSLTGEETKSIRLGQVSIQGAYISIDSIPVIKCMDIFLFNSKRKTSREIPILMKSSEIIRWRNDVRKHRYTIIVGSIHNLSRKIKAIICMSAFIKKCESKKIIIEKQNNKHKSWKKEFI